jgi:uncharacterized protein YjeT (DUF2065 family)
MNILLWTLQVALAFLCVSGGIFQIFKLEELKKGVAAMRALPRAVWTFLGAFGCVAGLCLILPAAGLTPIAAAAVAVQSAVISALYLRYRDKSPMPYSMAMVMLAAFICYGRLEIEPL